MQEPQTKCYFHALKYISRYPKTEKELRIYLLEKGYSQKDIDSSLDFLKFRGYIDDENFVDMYFSSEVIKKGRPVYVAKNKLRQKGIDKNIISSFVQEHEEEIQEGLYQKIAKIIEQYKKKDIDGFEIIQKIMRK
ncbi:MAG: regulatory protein RecX [bacterium]|nr:regulatory protein RecX [bacterium]